MRYLLFGLVFLFTVACTILGLVLRLALPALAGPMKALYALLMATAVARFVLGIRPGSPAEDEAPADKK